jgi:hypothetical protein
VRDCRPAENTNDHADCFCHGAGVYPAANAAAYWHRPSGIQQPPLGVKVEAVRIGDSPAAPLLTLIVGPSEEAESISQSKKQFAERYDERHRWWSKLVAHPEAKLHKHITPGSYSWIGTTGGIRGLNLNYVVWQDESAAELYIDRGNGSDAENKAIFDQLERQKPDIEKRFGGPLEWERLEGRRASRIRVTLPGGYRSPESEWDEIQARQVDAMNRFNNALQPALKTLKLGADEPSPA